MELGVYDLLVFSAILWTISSNTVFMVALASAEKKARDRQMSSASAAQIWS